MPDILSVDNLKLTNFRNYKNLNLSFSKKPIIITGPNGSGKTNILEAISLLSPGKGIRNVKFEEMNSRLDYGNYPWKIDSLMNSESGLCEINTYGSFNPNGQYKRIIRIDGQITKTQNELAKIFSIIWLIPQMDHLFISKKSNRRKFLDKLVYNFDPEHGSRILKYENLLRERMRLLKNSRYDSTWLNSIEHTIAEIAIAISYARVQSIDYLQKTINNMNSAFPKARLYVKGGIEAEVNNNPAIILEEKFKEKLASTRQLDLHTNRTHTGVHLSDLLVYHDKKNLIANLCSTGEQKSMLVTIILAEAKTKMALSNSVPVLLLDEIVTHLDEKKRNSLFDELLDLNAQSFITGTDIDPFTTLKNKAEFITTNELIK